jgi:hypothetical protein
VAGSHRWGAEGSYTRELYVLDKYSDDAKRRGVKSSLELSTDDMSGGLKYSAME